MKTKICSKCKKEQLISYFIKSSRKLISGEYGWNPQCKICRADRQKIYYYANKEKILKKHKKYRTENKEKICKQRHKYLENNKEAIREQSKKYYYANKEKINERHKQYCIEHKKERELYIKAYCEKNKARLCKQRHERYIRNKESEIKKSIINNRKRRRLLWQNVNPNTKCQLVRLCRKLLNQTLKEKNNPKALLLLKKKYEQLRITLG